MPSLEQQVRSAYTRGDDLLSIRNRLIRQGHAKGDVDGAIDHVLHADTGSFAGRHRLLIASALILLSIALVIWVLFGSADVSSAETPAPTPRDHATPPAPEADDEPFEQAPPQEAPQPENYLCSSIPDDAQHACIDAYLREGGECDALTGMARRDCERVEQIRLLTR